MANDDIELLHNFAHDLKTPLSAIKSFIELLEAAGELNDKQQHFADRALSNVGRMQGIISALLEFARMEGTVEIDVDVCDLLEVVEDITAMTESLANEKQVEIHINIQPDAQFVQADSHLLGHVLTNLISNAVKYNRIGGHVYISSVDANDFVEIRVRDTGLGIPSSAIDRIFDRFYRVESKDHMKNEGTGIGLSIVKSVIDKHGGEIKVESIEDEGSEFIFTLPRASTFSPDYNREPTDGLDDRLQEARDIHEDSDSGEMR